MNAIWQVLLALLAAVGLLARGQGIVLCPAERLGEYIKA